MFHFKLSYSLYSLRPRQSPFSKEGMLLRAEDKEGNIKYADCSPWPSLGDESLESHIQCITTKDGPSELVRAALLNAPTWSTDVNKILTSQQPCSHTLITQVPQAFNLELQAATLKVKIGRAPKQEINWLSEVTNQHPDVRWRLDANALFSASEWEDFWQQLPVKVQSQVDYVEDPFAYQAELWTQWNQQVPLALDFATEAHLADPGSYQIYVFKPSRQLPDILLELKEKPIAITSQLGHALDCLNSLYYYQQLAAQGYQLLPIVGCLNQNIYEDPFYQIMQIKQGFWINAKQSLRVWDQCLREHTSWVEVGEVDI